MQASYAGVLCRGPVQGTCAGGWRVRCEQAQYVCVCRSCLGGRGYGGKTESIASTEHEKGLINGHMLAAVGMMRYIDKVFEIWGLGAWRRGIN